MAQQSVCYHF